MKKLKWTLITPILFGAYSSFAASTGGGNGGDVFICEDPSQNMILDFYEGEEKGMFDHFGSPALSLRENFLKWSAILKEADPKRGYDLEKRGLELITDIEKIESQMVKRTDLVSFTNSILLDKPDSLEFTNPRGCTKYQIAIQTEMSYDNSFLIIQRDLWNQIENNQKAILIAHEVTYEMFLDAGDTDSINTRFFNQKVMSKQVSEMNFCEYYIFLQKLLGDDQSIYAGDLNTLDFFEIPLIEGVSCDGDRFNFSDAPYTEIHIVASEGNTSSELRIPLAKINFESIDKHPFINPVIGKNTISFDFNSSRYIPTKNDEFFKLLKKDIKDQGYGKLDSYYGFRSESDTSLEYSKEEKVYKLKNMHLRGVREFPFWTNRYDFKADITFTYHKGLNDLAYTMEIKSVVVTPLN